MRVESPLSGRVSIPRLRPAASARNDKQALSATQIAALVLGVRLVGIAIQPALTRLRRCHDGMPAGARVFARVLVRRIVAALGGAALLARAQVHPPRARLHALFAFVLRGVSNRGDGRDVTTGTDRHSYPRQKCLTRDHLSAEWMPSGLQRLRSIYAWMGALSFRASSGALSFRAERRRRAVEESSPSGQRAPVSTIAIPRLRPFGPSLGMTTRSE
jgi:hypothetical protein